jgi:hypothetical protein
MEVHNMMSRKIYRAFAEVLSSATDRAEIIQGMVRIFARDNGRFDAERFIQACQPPPAPTPTQRVAIEELGRGE